MATSTAAKDVQFVMDCLALPKVCTGAVDDLLCTYQPEDITTEMVEATLEAYDV